MDEQQQADRLRALWKSARDKYASFFTTLNEVRGEVGDDALPTWCIHNLGIGISVILNVSEALTKTDREVVRAKLAAANKAENEAKAKEAAEKRRAREEERRRRELAKEEEERAREQRKLEHAREMAEKQAEVARLAAERNKAEATERRRQKKQDNPNERGAKATAKRTKRALTEAVSEADFAELVRRFKKADEMCAAADAKWIEGSIAKAMILLAMRNACPADQEFGARLASDGITIDRNDRAALVSLGRLGEARMRSILEKTDRRSYRYIWEENKPKLAIVGTNA